MLSYHRLKDNFRAFRTFTSLDRSEFETLLPSFEVAWNTYVYDNHITKKKRQRRFGGGRKARLASLEEQWLFLLVYGKIDPLQAGMASLLAMRQGRVHAWMHTRRSVWQRALGHAQC